MITVCGVLATAAGASSPANKNPPEDSRGVSFDDLDDLLAVLRRLLRPPLRRPALERRDELRTDGSSDVAIQHRDRILAAVASCRPDSLPLPPRIW